MELYMLLKKPKRLVLLVYGLNVILSWFVLHLRLGLGTCFNYYGKIKFRISHIFCDGNARADKVANLWFIHREQFHCYNRLPFSIFLEFFINRYKLPKYHFC